MTFSISTFAKTDTVAQTDTVNVPGDIPPGEGNLNNYIKERINSGTLSNTVFKLEPYGYYILTDSIVVPKEEHLTIVAPEPGNTQETAPPQIIWSSNMGGSKRYILKVFGDLTLKNIWLMYANTNGWQVFTAVSFISDSLNAKKQYGNFEGVIFDYSGIPANASGAICVETNKFIGTFKNCYWKNNTDFLFRYYGRAVSFPFDSQGWHIDSLTFENCTFSNIGYVYMQEGGEYGDNVHFNHCTFHNVVMYTLESGWWYKMSLTNSIFVNTYMYGDIPAYRDYRPPISYNEPNGGTIRIDSISNFGFDVPFIEQKRRVLFTNSSYSIEKWLSDWMQNCPNSQWLRENGRLDEIPVPQPMLSPGTLEFLESDAFPYMNKASLYDSTDPGLINPPIEIDSLKEFLECRWCCGCGLDWAWKPENSVNRLWPLEENLAYTNDTLLTAGMGGFPLGDLYHWFPDKYIQWKAQEGQENERILQWLETGNDPGVVGINEPGTKRPVHFKLYQNYPNPFNPTTQIEYTLPTNVYISLKVYNLLGQEVITLFEGLRKPGNYTATFDGKGLSSGIYFYQLKAENIVETKKLMLLR